MKKMIIVFLFLSVLVLSRVTSVDASQISTNEESRLIMQEQANKLKKFSEKKDQIQKNDYFDDAYGGVFFENESLHVNITSNYIDIIKSEFDIDIDYILVEVQYSLKELEYIMNRLIEDAAVLLIQGIGISEVNNRIVVQTELPFDVFLNSLDLNINQSMIELQRRETDLDERALYLLNGERIRIGTAFWGYSDCTVGFPAKDSSGNPGIVTAGHCLEYWTRGKNVYYDGNHAGDTRDYIYHEGTVDAGFIELRDPLFEPSQDLVFGGSYDYLSTNSSYYAVGTYVQFRGTYGNNSVRTYAIDYGVITNVSFTWIEGGVILNSNMIEAEIITHSGDSGGPLLVSVYIGEGYYELNLIGILSAGTSQLSLFSKTYDILDELNLTVY